MSAPARLVAIIGPIAAGKSTVARALADALRGRDELVALVGLDDVAEMALPTLPGWGWAARVHAATVRAWLDTPVTTVIAEGPGTPEEVDALLTAVPAGAGLDVVLVHSDYPTALERARADPTRGVSRDPEFLRRVYARFDAERAALRHDLALDSAASSVTRSVGAIVAHLAR